MPLTYGGASLAPRAGVALVLAVLIHLSAWQTLAGIRVFLPRREPPPPMIDVALLPPPQTPIALPARRAVVRALTARRRGPTSVEATPLTAVRTGASGRPGPTRAAAPAPEARTQQPVPASGQSAAPKTSDIATAAPPPSGPGAASDQPVATAAPAETAPAPEPVSAAASAAPEPPPRSPPGHAAVQVVLPKSARLVYQSYGTVRVGGFMLGVRGRTTTRWRFQNGHYQSDLSIDVVNFVESSQGLFDPDFGLEPERYSETRPRRPVSTTQFDWANRRVTFTEDNRQGEAEPGTQDRLSVQFQLSVLRQVYPERFVRGSVVPITLAGTRDVSHWTFTVTGEEIVDSGLGHLPALRVLSNRTTASGDESLEVWISEKLNWFPVRIRIIDKNRNMIDSVLDEATID